jgi:hypothetical protein
MNCLNLRARLDESTAAHGTLEETSVRGISLRRRRTLGIFVCSLELGGECKSPQLHAVIIPKNRSFPRIPDKQICKGLPEEGVNQLPIPRSKTSNSFA